MRIYVGWDQSLNHGAIVAINDASEIVARYYFSNKLAHVKPGMRERIAVRLPPGIADEEDADLRSVLRLAWLRTYFQSVVRKVGPLAPGPEDVFVAVEGYPFAMAQGAHQIGEAGGVLRMVLWDAGFRFRLHDPKTVKLFATGRGDATKKEVADAALEAGVDFATYGTGANSPAEDLADAWVLARMARLEQQIRRGAIGLDAIEDRERQIFLRVTKHNPINLLSRPWTGRPAAIDPGWGL